MPLPPSLADWLRDRGHEAVHASGMGMALAQDELILKRAADEHRVVVTADLDFPRLIALAESDGPGLILFRAGIWSEHEIVARMDDALAVIPEGELPSSIVVIERTKIHRRRLPIGKKGSLG
jgi:predicted nuclease of predicted toxin-antitoxin system